MDDLKVDVASAAPARVRRDDGKIVLRVPLREVFEIFNDEEGEDNESS